MEITQKILGCANVTMISVLHLLVDVFVQEWGKRN